MRSEKKSISPLLAHTRVEIEQGDATYARVAGQIDELFAGLGEIGTPSMLVIDVSGITRMTSFGVRQWLRVMEGLAGLQVFLVGCPPFFVDQLNMVLNFGGTAKVVTLLAPYVCATCKVETDEPIDVIADRDQLAAGQVPEKRCRRCAGRLEFDEIPESYLACLTKYGAATVPPPVSQILQKHQLAGTVRTSRQLLDDLLPPSMLPAPALAPRAAPREVVRIPKTGAPIRMTRPPSEVFGLPKVLVIGAIVLVLLVAAYLFGRAT